MSEENTSQKERFLQEVEQKLLRKELEDVYKRQALNSGVLRLSAPRGCHVCQNSFPLPPKSMRT